MLADRVQETTTTTGTGTLNLAGAVAGFQSFVAGIGDGNPCYYLIQDDNAWEVGIGTVTDAATDTLSRTTVLASSNSDSKISIATSGAFVGNVDPADFLNPDGSEWPAASQAEMESSSAVNRIVTPGRQQFHPSAAKFWVVFTGTGTVTIRASYNVTSITDHGAGKYTVTIATDFSSANWCAQAQIEWETGGVTGGRICGIENGGQAAGTVRIQCVDQTAAIDFPSVFVCGYGDQ